MVTRALLTVVEGCCGAKCQDVCRRRRERIPAIIQARDSRRHFLLAAFRIGRQEASPAEVVASKPGQRETLPWTVVPIRSCKEAVFTFLLALTWCCLCVRKSDMPSGTCIAGEPIDHALSPARAAIVRIACHRLADRRHCRRASKRRN